MNSEFEVYVDLDGQAHLVGRLWSRLSMNRKPPLVLTLDRATKLENS